MLFCRDSFQIIFLTIIPFMHKHFYSVRFFFIALLLSICFGSAVNGQMYYTGYNVSTGGNTTTASYGNIMRYEVYAKNSIYSSAITDATLYANIPAGTTYVPGSTTENGVPVPDVNGKMPFAGSGRLINATSTNPGLLDRETKVIIQFKTQVTANTGNISASATVLGTTSSGPVNLTSAVSTPLNLDYNCSAIYESTSSVQPFGNPPTYPYAAIRSLSTTNGTGNTTMYNGATGPSYNAITGDPLPATLKNSAALAYDRNSRIYFVNNTSNPAEDLCFVDLKAKPVCARKYVGYPLETNTSAGYNINRMTFASDGYGYAITENGQDMIRFSVDPTTNLPVINRLGSLINDATNGIANDVLAETGGDIFGDGSGKLYLIPNSGKLYRIDPSTRIATYLSKISQVPAGGVNSVAVDQTGNVFIGGPYQNVFVVNFSTMIATSITSGSTSNVWTSGDYTSCILPVLGPALNATKSYTNTAGRSYVASGDQIEYTIEVSNTGNMSATTAKLYDALPAGSHYVAGSTTMNGVAIADIGGSMPFAVAGGQLVNTSTEPAGVIVPGDANKAVIKFRITTDAQTTICNQATITFNDVDGSTKFVISDDPAQSGTRDATCFYSDAALPPALIATKTWRCPFTGAIFVVAGDPVEYTITVTNTGANATGVTVYDAIPANSRYMAGTTKMNGVAIADIGGVMPFAVSGGQFINSPGQSGGVITPGAANKVTITFMVQTNPGTTVCNQATITYQHAGNNINVVTDNPATSGTQDATCFYSDVPPLGGRKAVNGTPENEQPAIIESVHVQPNPFIKDVNLQVQSNNEKAVQVRLIDFYGRTVFTTSQKLAKGTNSLKLHVPAGLSSGIYVLEVSAGNSRLLQKKLIKQ
jgi:uncharacterized repeat protein (TIGR01451 family)